MNFYKNRAEFELTEETDLFGVLPKANVIKNLLINNKEAFQGNNMLALYGDWGTGKTTVMRYIESELNKNKKEFGSYQVIFFEAWKYENDNNLALSLLEQIIDEVDIEEELSKKLKIVGETIFTLGKNMILNSGVSLLGIDLNIGQAGKDTIAEMAAGYEKKSMYSQVKEFQETFKMFEEKLADRGYRILVFVDDLDRCEPDNVLNLLASIKLFFTLGENILYFTGIDKKAITKAIQNKYNDVIKAEEYLEKIFDITFRMPHKMNLEKIVKEFFKVDKEEYEYTDLIVEFFNCIDFTIPRHIKKVLNKCLVLEKFRNEENKELIPLIRNANNPLLSIFIMYIIILHEFYPQQFDEVQKYKIRINKLISINTDSTSKPIKHGDQKFNANDYLKKCLYYLEKIDISKGYLNDIMYVNNDNFHGTTFNFHLLKILVYFSSRHIENYRIAEFSKLRNPNYAFFQYEDYIEQFNNGKDSILYKFLKFIVNNKMKLFAYIDDNTSFDVLELIDMARLYL